MDRLFLFPSITIEYAYHTLGSAVIKDGIRPLDILNRSPRDEFWQTAAKKIGRRWQVGALPKRRIYKENQCRCFESTL